MKSDISSSFSWVWLEAKRSHVGSASLHCSCPAAGEFLAAWNCPEPKILPQRLSLLPPWQKLQGAHCLEWLQNGELLLCSRGCHKGGSHLGPAKPIVCC